VLRVNLRAITASKMSQRLNVMKKIFSWFRIRATARARKMMPQNIFPLFLTFIF